jgi:hypothetical protein
MYYILYVSKYWWTAEYMPKKDTKPYAQLHIYAICTYVFSEFNKETRKFSKKEKMNTDDKSF